jgi:hypothetical protein
VGVRNRTGLGAAATLAVTLLGLAGAARADGLTVAAGQEVTLDADLSLGGTDMVVAGDQSGARCTIHGAGHQITSVEGWTGSLAINNCDIDGLGMVGGGAITVTVVGTSAATIQGSTFSASAVISITASDQAPVTFVGNTIQSDSLVAAVVLLADSQPAVQLSGSSTGTKVFSGNKIFKSRASFGVTGGWLIEDNIIVGLRAGIDLGRVTDTQVRGNYIHTMIGAVGWNQVKNLSIIDGSGLVIEHNVLWGFNWLVELNAMAQVQYNLILNAIERGWVLVYSRAGARVHHNVLVATKENSEYVPAGGFVVEDGSDQTIPVDLEIYNNTFDAGDTCTRAIGGAVVLHGATVNSVRSNAFVGIRTLPDQGPGLVHGGETAVSDPLPSGLGYADYNLFYNPDSPVKVNYSTGVDGKQVRTSAGFAYNDIHVGGPVNEQADPKFAMNPVPRGFPFDEAAVIAGTTTVCQILAFYRQVYAPGTGSPLANAGDPADGSPNIGAIGAGTGDPTDKFGTLCDPGDVGTPNLAPDMFTCPSVPLQPTSTGSGGTGVPPGPHGFACVCDVHRGEVDGSGAPVGALTLACLAALAAAGRRRSGRRRPTRCS